MANLTKSKKKHEVMEQAHNTMRFTDRPDHYQNGDTITVHLSDGSKAVFTCKIKKPTK